MKNLRIESTFVFRSASHALAWAGQQLKDKSLPAAARSCYENGIDAGASFVDAGTIFSPPKTWIIQPLERQLAGEVLLKIQWICSLKDVGDAIEPVIDSNLGLPKDLPFKIVSQLKSQGYAQYSTEGAHGFIHTTATLMELR